MKRIGEIFLILLMLGLVAGIFVTSKKCSQHEFRARTMDEFLMCKNGCRYSCGHCDEPIYVCKDSAK